MSAAHQLRLIARIGPKYCGNARWEQVRCSIVRFEHRLFYEDSTGAKRVPVVFSIVLKTVHMVEPVAASDDGPPKLCSKEQMMSPSQSVERSIIRQLLNRRAQPRARVSVEFLITTLSIVAGLGLLAVFVPGLLGALFVGAVVLALGS